MQADDALMRQNRTLEALAASLGGGIWHDTHISRVLVAGGFAYKFKKAVRFDFADFSTLALRRFYCEEELRLNARHAADIYLEVVAVAGSPECPAIGGEGPAIEYAVKMRAFEQDALWSRRLPAGLVTEREIDALAAMIAQAHAGAPVAPAAAGWGTPQSLQAVAEETLADLERLLAGSARRGDVRTLRAWEEAQRTRLRQAFVDRRDTGAIRECHGDLHCGNILTEAGRVQAFDCIEFNERLRWIDVINDIAFACMDLRFRGCGRFAARLLSGWLEITGDYGGLRLADYYETHRALVRCKVVLLRAEQSGQAPATEAGDGIAYLDFAMRRIEPSRPVLLITRGFSGSGKSTVAGKAVELLGAIRLRSDVERKRLARDSAGADAPFPRDIYAAEATDRTYARLLALARQALDCGRSVVVDATFLHRRRRQPFRELAAALGIPFAILDLRVDAPTLRERIARRAEAGSDPSDATLAILERQLADHEPLTPDEEALSFPVDRNGMLDGLSAWLASTPAWNASRAFGPDSCR